MQTASNGNGKLRAAVSSAAATSPAAKAVSVATAGPAAALPPAGQLTATAAAALLSYLKCAGRYAADPDAAAGGLKPLDAAGLAGLTPEQEAQLKVLHLAAGSLTDDDLLRLLRALYADQLLAARAAGDSAALLKLLDKGALLFGRLRTAPKAAPAAEAAAEPQLELGVEEACAEVQQLLAALAAEQGLEPSQLAELALPLSLLSPAGGGQNAVAENACAGAAR